MKQSDQSNPYHVIAIKELDFLEAETEEKDTTYEDQLDAVLLDIDHAKKQLANVQLKKSQLMEEIRMKINKEKEKWVEEKEIERKQAEKEGYQHGFEAGKKEALNQYDSMLQEINNQYGLAIKDYHKIIEEHSQMIINLAMTTANKILDEQLANTPEKYVNIVKKVIGELKDNETITIMLHPNNYQSVYEQRDELEQLIDEESVITFQIDATLSEGDCIIKHRFGQIDASIDVQLQQIKTALKESVSEN